MRSIGALRRAKTDSHITSVVLIPGSLDSPLLGQGAGGAGRHRGLHALGKPVTAYLEYGGDREYYLATRRRQRSTCCPSSSLDLTGVASYEMFLRGTFDKVGAFPIFIHIGDYKTATNQLTEKTHDRRASRDGRSRSTATRSAQLVPAIAEGAREVRPTCARSSTSGPFLPKKAVEAGLVRPACPTKTKLDDRRAGC